MWAHPRSCSHARPLRPRSRTPLAPSPCWLGLGQCSLPQPRCLLHTPYQQDQVNPCAGPCSLLSHNNHTLFTLPGRATLVQPHSSPSLRHAPPDWAIPFSHPHNPLLQLPHSCYPPQSHTPSPCKTRCALSQLRHYCEGSHSLFSQKPWKGGASRSPEKYSQAPSLTPVAFIE